MKVDIAHRAPCPPAALVGVLTDQQFLETYAARTGSQRYSVAVHRSGEGATEVTTSRVDRTFATSSMPPVVRRLVGAELDVVEIVAWAAAGQSTWHGDVAVDIDVAGRDATFRGRAVLSGDATSTSYALRGEVRIKLPLVGGTIEKLAADMIQRAILRQLDLAAERLR